MSTVRSISAILLTKEKSVHVLFKDPLPLSRRPTTAILIRARSVVQVHPGPPFIHQQIRGYSSLFPFLAIFFKKPFCQPFVNFTFSRIPLHSGRSPYPEVFRLDSGASQHPPLELMHT
jgi:hypothetical protein